MNRTVEMVRNASAQVGLHVEIRTLCLSVREGYGLDQKDRPIYVGMEGVDFLFGEPI